MTPLLFSHLMIFAVRIYEKALVVVLSVHIFLPLYGFCVCIVVCVRVNLSFSSMALACNVSRARRGWGVTLICDTSSVSFSDDASMVTDRPTRLSSAHWQEEGKRQKEREEEEEKKSTTNMLLLPYSQPITALLASSVWLLFLSKSPGWWWVS